MRLAQLHEWRVYPYLRLFRLFETTLAAGTIALALLFLGIKHFYIVIISFVSVIFGGICINSWNDSLDYVEDAIAHPDRPIPSGTLSSKKAQTIGSFSGLLSVSLIFGIGLKAMIILSLAILVGIIYSFTTKRLLLMKNLTVSATAVFVLISLPWILGKDLDVYFVLFAISIAMLLFGYEILKDIRDQEGDSFANIETLPLRIGGNRAAKIAAILFVGSCLLMAASFLGQHQYQEALVSLLTAVAIFPLFRGLWSNPIPSQADKTRYLVVAFIGISLSIISWMILS